MPKLQDYKQIAKNLIENDQTLKGIIYPEMDKMGTNDWELPEPLGKMTWLKKRIDPAPRNAEIAGVRAYATMQPRPRIVRPGMSPKDKTRYSQIEELLTYQYMLASRRPNSDMWLYGTTPTEKILRSAIRYGEVAVQVVHVDAQLDLMGDIKESRKRSIKQYGDFIINVHDPKNVHVRNSGLATEGVLLKKWQTLAEFVGFWGEKADPLLKKHQDEEDFDRMVVCSYDYTTHDERVIWANVTATESVAYGTYLEDRVLDGTQIMHEEMDMPFLPWVVRGGVEPLNYAVYETGAWEASNVAETLSYSEVITYTAAPRTKVTGPNPESVIIDYGEPGNRANVPTGHDIEDMRPPQVSDAHVLMGDRARRDLKSATVPSVVTDLSYPSDTSFAAFDSALQAGLAAYEPFKQLADRVIEEVMCHKLYWSKYLDKPMSAPYANRAAAGDVDYSFDEMGDAFVLNPSTYDYGLTVTVDLKANETIDEQQKINTAINMVQHLGVDQRTALDYIGELNPEKIEENRIFQELRNAQVGRRLTRIQAQAEVEAQAEVAGIAKLLPFLQDPNFAQQALQMLQQMAQQVMQQAQSESQRPSGEEPMPNPENTGQGLRGVEGQMNNAAAGGRTAAESNPRGNAEASR